MSGPRPPRIAALGGGTGLSNLLRGLKTAPLDLTAIVTVADDGGSSGRLRRELGVLPPGDIRNCLVALADDESLLGRLFQYRFADGDLAGHSFGNLFLAALTEVTGSFDLAVRESSRVLKINGRVLPSTLEQVRLWAERDDGTTVCGETQIGAGIGACLRVWLDPSPEAHPRTIDAILDADLVLLGPGSLFTSVLPHLAVRRHRRRHAGHARTACVHRERHDPVGRDLGLRRGRPSPACHGGGERCRGRGDRARRPPRSGGRRAIPIAGSGAGCSGPGDPPKPRSPGNRTKSCCKWPGCAPFAGGTQGRYPRAPGGFA